MEITPTRRITCKECATAGQLKWLPCADHHLVIPVEMCGHEHNSVIFIHNGVGVSCHDCGSITILEIGG
jgi:ribosomal protein S27E